MARFLAIGALLALMFGHGQALADSTCLYATVSIASGGSISVNCDAGKSASATLYGTSTRSCTYAGSSHTPAIRINGSNGLIEAWCAVAAANGVTFTISAADTATLGIPLPVSVSRSKGSGTLGDDTLNLATLAGSTAQAEFNPAALSFGANEPDGTGRTPRVIFTRAGQAILTATSHGNTVVNSIPITVNRDSTGTESNACAGISVPPYATDAGSAGANMGKHRLIAASASDRASASIRFTAPASGSLTFNLAAPGSGYPELSALDMAVSACPGDFSPTHPACKRPGVYGDGVKVTIGSTDCPIAANGLYFLNLRSATPGRDVGLSLSAQ